eukprot:scaffold2028_cov191-Amphora_coffeaeformis.AAC.4
MYKTELGVIRTPATRCFVPTRTIKTDPFKDAGQSNPSQKPIFPTKFAGFHGHDITRRPPQAAQRCCKNDEQ